MELLQPKMYKMRVEKKDLDSFMEFLQIQGSAVSGSVSYSNGKSFWK